MAPQLRSQLLPIGAPASACPRRHLLTGRPWRLVEASCTLGPALCTALVPSLPRPSVDGRSFDSAGGIRTHGLELMRLARTARLLYRAIRPAGVEPAEWGTKGSSTHDPGTIGLSIHVPGRGVDAAGGPFPSGGLSRPVSRSTREPSDVFQATRLPFDPGSPAAGLRNP